MTDQTGQKWFLKFHVGNFSLDNVPQSGGPAEVDNNQMETLIQISQCFTTPQRETTYSKYPNQAWKSHLLSQYNQAQSEQLTPVLCMSSKEKSFWLLTTALHGAST